MSINIDRHPLDQSPFFKLRSKRKLADLLRISQAELRRMSRSADCVYREFSVKKKDGTLRGVEDPARGLKLVQARIARQLSKIRPPDYLFCPVKGRCYVSNAAQHQGNRVVHCLDIRKYFPSTPSRRVFWFFHTVMQCERDVAATLAKLATYRGYLPTGSPLSPIMAYFAHNDVWEAIAAICVEHGYTLTVYIDDVTISAPKIDPKVIWSVKRIIHASGLRYHKEKVFHDRAAEITGVIVSGKVLAAPNRQLKKIAGLRSTIRGEEKRKGQGRETKELRLKLDGLNGQVRQISVQMRRQATQQVVPRATPPAYRAPPAPPRS